MPKPLKSQNTQNTAGLDTKTTSATSAAKPDAAEIASIRRDPNFAGYQNVLPEADKLIRSRGGHRGVDFYDDLKTETVVLDKLERRILGLVSKPWEVTAGGDSAQDKAATEWVTDLLERIEFDQLCKDLTGEAVLKGRAIVEIMWGTHAGYVVPQAFKLRRASRFQYDVDGALRLRTSDNLIPGELLPPAKFINHTKNATDDNPYGVGIGQTIWWPVFFKKRSIGFWLTFADKFGNPTSVGKYPVGATKAEQDTLLQALGAISQDSGIIIPEGMTIELLEAARSGISTYEDLCRYMDEMIARAIIGEADSSRDAGGALKAAADNRAEVRGDLLQADSDLLTTALQRDLFTPLINWNFPGAAVPRVWRNFEPPADQEVAVKIYKELHAMGYVPRDAEKDISETFGGHWIQKTAAAPLEAGAGLPASPPKSDTAGAAAFLAQLKAKIAAGRETQSAFAEAPQTPSLPDTVAPIIDRAMAESQPMIQALMAPMRKVMATSNNWEEAFDNMAALYGELPEVEFAEMVALALTVANFAGRAEIQAEIDAENQQPNP